MPPREVRPGHARGTRVVAAAVTLFLLGTGTPAATGAEPPVVRTVAEIRAAVAAAKPGTRIRIAPGTYDGGLYFTDLTGAPGKPIVLEAADPKQPPLFQGGANGLQLTDPAHVEVRGLTFSGATGNGVNVDDGGTPATPAHHVVLAGLVVRDVGPEGNRDGIKLSGLVDFRVEGATVERWGRGGSAVDMVGCRRGTIEGCTFRHEPASARASGVQAKGGSSAIAIRRNRFENAGSRAVNVGGSTGVAYFRPPLIEWTGERYEAKDVRVEGNTFLGSDTPVAFVGADACAFRFNTVYVPGRWALRILQETRGPGFVPCRGGEVTDNLIAFRSDAWSEGGVNRGPGTEPESFRFARNAWFCVDAPARTRALLTLPAPETDGRYGEDPRFRDAAAGDLTLLPGSPAARAGAGALPD